jgi:phytoene desaturase
MTKLFKIVVIGSGVAGLASACRLAKNGYNVQVFEAQETYGGKLGEIVHEGFRFDKGPSLFTLPDVLDDLFIHCGENPRDYYTYRQLPLIMKYFFPDGQTIDAHADVSAFQEELVTKLGEDPVKLNTFFKHIEEVYNFVSPVFLEHPLSEFFGKLKGALWQSFKMVFKIDAFKSLAESNKRWFKHEKTQMIFNRFATYNGSNPYQAPATLNVIPHLEHNLGAYYVNGGMREVSHSLYKLALKLGVGFSFNSPVSKITVKEGKVNGLVVNDTFISADHVVCNMDINLAYPKLLSDQKQSKIYLNQEKSSSALVFYWCLNSKVENLDVHNILFSDDYKGEFEYLRRGELSDDPTVYIYISAKADPKNAPEGKENAFVLINVPHDSGQDWPSLIAKAKAAVKTKINLRLNLNIDELILHEHILEPKEIERLTSSFGGALYGNSSNNIFAAFLRHPHKNKNIKQLSFVGGSVHPGGGIPLCLLSAKIACDRIKE